MEKKVDVLVVGGGPAGLAAAMVCARSGLKTLVAERRRFPVRKACGQGIMPIGVQRLAELGAARHLSQEDVFPFKGISYHAGKERAEGIFVQGPGWGVGREALSNAMFAQAMSIPGLEVWQEAPALPLEQRPEGVQVLVDGLTITARLLVGADGLNSRVRRWAGLDGPPPSIWRWGAVQDFEVKPWSEFVEVYWGDGVEAYLTPLGSSRIGIAFLWERAYNRKVAGGRGLIASLLQAFPELSSLLADSLPVGPPAAAGPLQRRVPSPVHDSLVLVGDAAGYLDALTGEGISLALGQALLLEKHVVPLLHEDHQSVRRPQLARYVKDYQELMRPYYRAAKLALFFSGHPILSRGAVQMLSRSPSLFQRLLSASMGQGSFLPGKELVSNSLRWPLS